MSVAPTSVHSGHEPHRGRWMLAVILAFLLGGLAGALLYQSDLRRGSASAIPEGSGVPATQTRDVGPFTGVELAGSNNVVIRVGPKQTVVVKADDNFLNRVTTDVRSGRLVIANTPGSFSTKSPMSVEITVPTLTALTLSGSGNVVANDIQTDSLMVALPGSGTLTAGGTTSRLDVTVSGAGDVQFKQLVADDVRVLVSGSGTVFVTATRSLDASVSGSGAVLYAGSPEDVTKSVTGSGAITGS